MLQDRFDKLGFDEWMKRVVNEYLGRTGIYCNVFVANALRYAGSSTPGSDMSVKYTDFANGGFVISSSNICSDWALRKVIAKAILAQNGSWVRRRITSSQRTGRTSHTMCSCLVI